MKNVFWRINRPESQQKRARWADDKMELEVIKCPVSDGHQREGKRLNDLNIVLPDYAVEDFVWTWYSECLVQDRILDLLRSEGVAGFEVKPVTASFKKSTQRPPKLWEVIVTGWASMAKPESGIRFDEAKSCSACNMLRYTGLQEPDQLIDETKWDGSDIFIVWPLPKFIFVTDRVRQLIQAHGLTGCRFTKVEELTGLDDGFGPGRLRYYMPEKRARELGEPLGIY